MIFFLILIFFFGVAAYFALGYLFPATSKPILLTIIVCSCTVIVGFLIYQINKSVDTLPEGAYYIDESELNDEGVFKEPK